MNPLLAILLGIMIAIANVLCCCLRMPVNDPATTDRASLAAVIAFESNKMPVELDCVNFAPGLA